MGGSSGDGFSPAIAAMIAEEAGVELTPVLVAALAAKANEGASHVEMGEGASAGAAHSARARLLLSSYCCAHARMAGCARNGGTRR